MDDLSLAELEALVESRRRIERARQFADPDPKSRFRPITIDPTGEKSKASPPEGASQNKRRSWRDRILLLIEISAVLGLVAVIVSSLGSLQKLNDDASQSQRSILAATSGESTRAPEGVLPGSSFPPADLNLSELPGSSSPPEGLPLPLGVNVQSSPSLPPPTAGPESPTRIVIPNLSIDWPIVEGDGWEELKSGVGHHVGSANPGERGNLVLSGHDDIFGEVFKDLEKLQNGDLIQVFAGGHAFRYQVRAKRVVSPSELSVLEPTREPIVTLITCTPYRVDSMRLVVIAQLVP